MKTLLSAILFLCLFAANVHLYSSTGHDVAIDCPLCGTKVSYWEQLSYSIFTYGLDLKPMGAARIPQPIPKCENCGFAFIEDYFNDEEIKTLRHHIVDQNAFSGKENFPDYYYLAFETELLNSKNYDEVVYFYVCSVWEYSFSKLTAEYMEKEGIENVNGINFETDKFIFLMQNAIEKINYLDNDSGQYNNMQLVKLDFLRRSNLFDEAKALIESIKNNERIYQGIAVDIIAYQIELIEKSDVNEHYLNEIEKND
ncbi:MAG: hypothetical protein LBO65_06660 [Spirochaetaceae bacterium]|jgi:hypothetical protein|nr:hypothetical protein [Spirochaetaceae bacterium]